MTTFFKLVAPRLPLEILLDQLAFTGIAAVNSGVAYSR